MATTFNVTAPEEFILPCTATGMPPPAVVWLKDGTQLSVESQKYSIETVNLEEFTVHSELTVQNTELTDQGQYTCIATNSAGSDSSVFAVSVHSELLWSQLYAELTCALLILFSCSFY